MAVECHKKTPLSDSSICINSFLNTFTASLFQRWKYIFIGLLSNVEELPMLKEFEFTKYVAGWGCVSLICSFTAPPLLYQNYLDIYNFMILTFHCSGWPVPGLSVRVQLLLVHADPDQDRGDAAADAGQQLRARLRHRGLPHRRPHLRRHPRQHLHGHLQHDRRENYLLQQDGCDQG